MLKRICVYCGSNGGDKPAYLKAAVELGKVLAENRIGLVYGAGNIGIMGAVAQSALDAGGEVIGVTPQVFVDMKVVHFGLTELKVVQTMHERKALMADLADAFIALPGGLGTFEELFETLTWAQLGFHDKPVGILNVERYYDQLISFLNFTVAEKFVKADHLQMLIVEQDPAVLLQRFKDYKPKKISKII